MPRLSAIQPDRATGKAKDGGYPASRLVHFWLTMGYLAFFLIHIAQVIRTGWNKSQSIVVGAELASEREPISSE